MQNITKTLFIIAIFAITSNAEFIIQSTFTNNNCDTSSGYVGNAVIQINLTSKSMNSEDAFSSDLLTKF
jgi:hypothetical protein